MSQLFAWGGQSTGVSASASFPPKKFQGWSPSEWTGWISLQSKRLSRVFSNTTVSFQSQRKAMPKNAQTTAQFHSSHMLIKIKKRLMQMLPWWWKERVRGPDWSLFQYELPYFSKWSEFKVLIVHYPLSFEDSQSRKPISGPSHG